uniref:Uncharacterized protein n=2 Tax=Vespula TaxID=7451 RepID=A0A834KRE8_VESPE|nr:hypothetical protein H0235_013244 [Vespula pensylvanica]
MGCVGLLPRPMPEHSLENAGGRGSCPSTAFWRDAASSRSYRQQLFALSCHRLQLPPLPRGGGILQVARQSSRLVVVMSCWSVETTTNGDDSTVLKEEKAGKGCPQS